MSIEINLVIIGIVLLIIILIYNLYLDRIIIINKFNNLINKRVPVVSVSLEEDNKCKNNIERINYLNENIDLIIYFNLKSSFKGYDILDITPNINNINNEIYYIEGFDNKTNDWRKINYNENYLKLRIGIQLARRLGFISANEFNKFINKAERLAKYFNTEIIIPNIKHELNRAENLYKLINNYDINLIFNLVSLNKEWSTKKINKYLYSLEFIIDESSNLKLLNKDNSVILSIYYDKNIDLINNIKIILEVPKVSQNDEPFLKIYNLITSFCQDMKANLYDNSGNQISFEDLNDINNILNDIYIDLENNKIPAGSDLAKRLFS